MDKYFVTAYTDEGKVVFSKSSEDLSALMDVVNQGITKNEVYRTQLKAAKVKELRIVVEERCLECGTFHVTTEYQDIL